MTVKNFFLGYTFTLLGLFLLDSVTTLHLSNNIHGGEINPFLDTESFWSILLSPVRLTVLSLCCVCVWFFERHKKKMLDSIGNFFEIKTIFIFPYVIWLFVAFAVTNNFMLVYGYEGPISWFVKFFEDKILGAIIFYAMLSFVFYPISERFYWWRYKNFMNENTSSENRK